MAIDSFCPYLRRSSPNKSATSKGVVLNLLGFPGSVKGTVSPYKRIFSNGSRMGIPIIQSSTWAMWFCDVAITPLARAWPAELALHPRLGVYFGVSWRNPLHECTEGYRRAGLPLSLMRSLGFLGLSAIVGALGSIDR